MIVKNLKVAGFRNFENLEVSFSEKKNLIHGLNGTGKTSILEALFMIGFGKSFLNVKKSDVINYRSKEFVVNLNLENEFGNHDLSAFFNNNFSLLLDGKRTNLMEINKYFYPVFFSSSNYSQSVEAKSHKRKMFDRFIFGVDSLYIHYILCYNKSVKQKNFLLKTKNNFSELSSWNRTISEMAEKIINTRK